MKKTYRVIICGTLFGQVYLSAFQRQFPGFVLAGILANGSERSYQLAQAYSVPLYSDVAQLPQDIDIACVVIRSDIVGGQGSVITKSLLKRGIHVLQEHPVYETDVVECLKLARENNCRYTVNTHYPTVPAVQYFIDFCRELTNQHAPLFVEATCGVQVVCGLLDMLSRALGGSTPFAFQSIDQQQANQPTKSIKSPYCVVQGMLGGIPLILKIQNQLDPTDPDNHFHIMHRVSIGFPSGNVLLVNTHGPVLWNRAFYIPRKASDQGVREIIDREHAAEFYQPPMSEVIYSGDASLAQILDEYWAMSVQNALRQFSGQIEQSSSKSAQHIVSQAQVWKALMSRLGNPEVISSLPPIAPVLSVRQWLAEYESSGLVSAECKESNHA